MPVCWSLGEFDKIVEELIDNAFKFSEPGKPVLVATEVHGGEFVLTVADKGRGLRPTRSAESVRTFSSSGKPSSNKEPVSASSLPSALLNCLAERC